MGWYTAIVFNNDVVHYLDDDPEAGKKIHAAIRHASIEKPTPVQVGRVHVGDVVAQEHADALSVMTLSVGRGTRLLGHAAWGESDVEILKRLADERGYTLHKKRRK